MTKTRFLLLVEMTHSAVKYSDQPVYNNGNFNPEQASLA